MYSISNVTLYAVIGSLGSLLVGAVGLAVFALVTGDVPQFIGKFDHDNFGI
jgi:hypothetical protein